MYILYNLQDEIYQEQKKNIQENPHGPELLTWV